jgi:hypothetical protein
MVQVGGGEPGETMYEQPISAACVEESESCLVFTASDGSLAGYFDSSVVISWREVTEK